MIQESMIHFRRIRGQHTLSSLLSHTGAQQSTFSDLHLCFTSWILFCFSSLGFLLASPFLSFSPGSTTPPTKHPSKTVKNNSISTLVFFSCQLSKNESVFILLRFCIIQFWKSLSGQNNHTQKSMLPILCLLSMTSYPI